MRNCDIVCLPMLPPEYVWKIDKVTGGAAYSFDIYWQCITIVADKGYYHTEPDGKKYRLFVWTTFVYKPEDCVGFYTLDPLDLDGDASQINMEGGMQACLDLMAARVWMGI